jgi:hypothetical protein
MKEYFYNEETNELLFEQEAFIDPLETELAGHDIFMLSANATFIEPPAKRDGYAIVWNGEAWDEVEDHRGTQYWFSSDSYYSEPMTMNKLGALPKGITLTRPEKTADEIAIEEMIKAKSERADYVSKIVVEVDGMKFDGDETSQDRMARSVVALNDDSETVQWVLADNTVAQVTRVQLKQALRLAGEAQTAIWANPYL